MADIRNSYKGMVAAVGGPPHSGKSVFLAELYRQLLARKPSGTFLQRACPDGEGMWSDEADQSLVKKIRRKYKFTPEFMRFQLGAIPQLGRNMPRVLVDLGGIRSEENAALLRCCTHLFVVSGDEAEVQPWLEFGKAQGCEVLGAFGSRLVKIADGKLDGSVRSTLNLTTIPVSGELLNLDRDEPNLPYAEAISQFAEWLIEHANATR